MTTKRVHLTISGLVQGVFYRASAADEADRLGLKGWVRNLPTGDVEAEAEGPAEQVEKFIAWCRIGPRAARVDDVTIDELPPGGQYSGFAVVR